MIVKLEEVFVYIVMMGEFVVDDIILSTITCLSAVT